MLTLVSQTQRAPLLLSNSGSSPDRDIAKIRRQIPHRARAREKESIRGLVRYALVVISHRAVVSLPCFALSISATTSGDGRCPGGTLCVSAPTHRRRVGCFCRFRCNEAFLLPRLPFLLLFLPKPLAGVVCKGLGLRGQSYTYVDVYNRTG